MKIALLSAASSIHTIRWANGLASKGLDVHLISQQPVTDYLSDKVHLHLLPNRGLLGYYLMVPKVKKLLSEIQPDLVNAHYASGYGTTAKLVDYHPLLLSVWGSDVYDFPYKSFLHKYIVRKNLLAADKVASTSHCMALQTQSIEPKVKDIAITPFGVDLEMFNKAEPLSAENGDTIVIGTVKTMAHKYGIDTLIEAFALLYHKLVENHPKIAQKLNLRLVGGGSDIDKLKILANKLNISDRVQFTGRVNYDQVPEELSKIDIYVALSRDESFGVAIIEAGAAYRPVVVSNVGGLPEVTVKDITGYIVPKENPQAAANAIETLVLDPKLRQKMGIVGRKHVEKNYSWDESLDIMIRLYENIINESQESKS